PLESGRIHRRPDRVLVRLLNGGTMAIDQDKLTEFLHKFVGDLGATMAAGNVLVGDRLGLYRALAAQPMLPHELAERTGTAARYVDEWLRGQAAAGYVEYGPQRGAYSLTPEPLCAADGLCACHPSPRCSPGSRYLRGSILHAGQRVADPGLAAQVRLDIASAHPFDGGPYALVTSFDCLHDMRGPLGAARHIKE